MDTQTKCRQDDGEPQARCLRSKSFWHKTHSSRVFPSTPTVFSPRCQEILCFVIACLLWFSCSLSRLRSSRNLPKRISPPPRTQPTLQRLRRTLRPSG